MTEIVVAGKGRFPIDMLRYDNCVPRGSEDAVRIEDIHYDRSQVRTIRLNRFSYDATKCEADRWKSFGWDVIEDSGLLGD